jgi:hypothetical protein
MILMDDHDYLLYNALHLKNKYLVSQNWLKKEKKNSFIYDNFYSKKKK